MMLQELNRIIVRMTDIHQNINLRDEYNRLMDKCIEKLGCNTEDVKSVISCLQYWLLTKKDNDRLPIKYSDMLKNLINKTQGELK